MKTRIFINGQPSGNSRLSSAIGGDQHRSFNDIYCIFKTKKAANKALWQAYQTLREKEPDFARGGIAYTKGFLRYDASSAKICD